MSVVTLLSSTRLMFRYTVYTSITLYLTLGDFMSADWSFHTSEPYWDPTVPLKNKSKKLVQLSTVRETVAMWICQKCELVKI